MSKKAFSILAQKDTDPIIKSDFIDLLKECALLPDSHQGDLNQIYNELDQVKKGNVSLDDFLRTLGADTPSSHHTQLLDSIMKNEPEILSYKANKQKRLLESISLKAFDD